jgi:hypothetical protein
LGRRRRRSSLQRHVGAISRRQDHSRDLAARHREGRPDGAVADIEMLAVRAHATLSGSRERRQLVANGRNRIVCGRCTGPDRTRCGGGGCGEQERSADRDLVQHLSSSLQAACWRRAGVRTDDANGYRQACSFERCDDAPQLWPPSPLGISKTASCCALMEANRNQSRTTIMITSQQTALAGRSVSISQDRAGSWIARLFSQPVVREIPQTTEWDNDVPPFPILAGAVTRPERRGQSQ